MSFADFFSIATPGGAYTDANGAAQQAAGGVPRFDHTAKGASLGLLVQGQPEAIAPDVVTLNLGVVGNRGCTILHTYQRPDGTVVSRAIWSTRPTSTINSLLNAKGWHQQLIVVPRALPVANGVVSFRGLSYPIEGYLAVSSTNVLGVGDAAGHLLTGTE